MTDVPASDASTTDAASVFAPAGRPVVRFVAAVAGVAAVFAALWWSGLFAARVDISVSEGFDRRANTGVAIVVVRNEGPLAARVGFLELASRPDDRYFEPPLRPIGAAPAREVRIDGGDTRRFTVRYTVNCAGYERAKNSERGAVSPSLRVRLHVEGQLGPGRSITHDEVALAGACGDPIDPEDE